jgi:hypothetical protein
MTEQGKYLAFVDTYIYSVYSSKSVIIDFEQVSYFQELMFLLQVK